MNRNDLEAEFPWGFRYIYSRDVGGRETILTVVGWREPNLVVSLATHPEFPDAYGDVTDDVMRRLPKLRPFCEMEQSP
jgi:hypothetical protein